MKLNIKTKINKKTVSYTFIQTGVSMNISGIQYQPAYTQNHTKSSNNQVNFTSNPNSPKLVFCYKDFFINIKGYGQNEQWANKVMDIADESSKKLRKLTSADDVLSYIAKRMKFANALTDDQSKRTHTGILRIDRKSYGKTGEWAYSSLQTPFGADFHNPYHTYRKRLAKLSEKPLANPFPDIELTSVLYSPAGKNGEMIHGDAVFINNALNRVGEKHFNLEKDYIQHPENVTKENLRKINCDIAEIRWILAHSTPWERGSDAIANTYMRALYKSMGIKTYPAKRGVSFDLEAFCTNLDEYKKNFHKYFKKPPEIME